jgi:hypothetical protein
MQVVFQVKKKKSLKIQILIFKLFKKKKNDYNKKIEKIKKSKIF